MISLNKFISFSLKCQLNKNVRIITSNQLINPRFLSNIHTTGILNKDSNQSKENTKKQEVSKSAFKTSDESSIKTYDSLSIKDKAKYMWNKYGIVAIGTYFGLYVTTLSSIFLSLDLDLFNAASFGVDPNYAIKKVCEIFQSVTGSASLPNFINDHPKVGTFAIAWVMTKFTEPIRLAVTLTTVPMIARLLGREPIDNIKNEKESK